MLLESNGIWVLIGEGTIAKYNCGFVCSMLKRVNIKENMKMRRGEGVRPQNILVLL